MFRSARLAALLAPIATLLAAPLAVTAHAAAITDPSGDFLSSFVDARTPDRDVVAASAGFANGVFDFSGTFAGLAGSTPSSVYVFGIDRGRGTARFGALAPGVLFDSVVIATPGGSTVVRDFLANTVTALAASATTISGNSIDILVPAALLPSTGFAITQYGVNLWPRSGLTNNNQIADFAPDNGDFGVTVPEPASMALIGSGLVLAALTRRRISRSPAPGSAAG